MRRPSRSESVGRKILFSLNFSYRYYQLSADRNWEIDLVDLESKIDENTACIVLNNPSNPCGVVYTREHLQQLISLAERRQVPIVADEIYRDLVFEGHTFVPLASLTSSVPILSVGSSLSPSRLFRLHLCCIVLIRRLYVLGGIAKVFMVPGWRVGWILVHDRNSLLADIRVALTKLSQLILGANTLVQSVLDVALHGVPAEFVPAAIPPFSSNSD